MKFEKILNLKNYADNSVKIYVHYVNEFILSFDKPVLHLTISDCKSYILNYNFSSISKHNQIYSAIKLFYKYILNIDLSNKLIFERPRKEKRLPRIIDKQYILSSCDKIVNLKHKSIILLAYSVGLRVSEVINLKIDDIDSKGMIINIRQAKGKKDRIVPLSENILIFLNNILLFIDRKNICLMVRNHYNIHELIVIILLRNI